MFLEKTKLKDDSSNYADWVHKLRIVLITAQKAYVLNAPLSVLNPEHHLWMLRTSDIEVFDDYMIVQCIMLKRLIIEALKTLQTSRDIRDVPRDEIGISGSFPC